MTSESESWPWVFLARRCFKAGNLSDLNHSLCHVATMLKRLYRLELKNREEEIRLLHNRVDHSPRSLTEASAVDYLVFFSKDQRCSVAPTAAAQSPRHKPADTTHSSPAASAPVNQTPHRRRMFTRPLAVTND